MFKIVWSFVCLLPVILGIFLSKDYIHSIGLIILGIFWALFYFVFLSERG